MLALGDGHYYNSYKHHCNYCTEYMTSACIMLFCYLDNHLHPCTPLHVGITKIVTFVVECAQVHYYIKKCEARCAYSIHKAKWKKNQRFTLWEKNSLWHKVGHQNMFWSWKVYYVHTHTIIQTHMYNSKRFFLDHSYRSRTQHILLSAESYLQSYWSLQYLFRIYFTAECEFYKLTTI